MVEDSTHPHTKRLGPLSPSRQTCRSVQRDRSCPIRANHLPRDIDVYAPSSPTHRIRHHLRLHILLGQDERALDDQPLRARVGERPRPAPDVLNAVRADVRAHQGVQVLVRARAGGVPRARDGAARVHRRAGRADEEYVRADRGARPDNR